MWSAFLLLTILFGTLALYVPTLAPGFLWGGEDFATSQTMAYLLEIQLPGGIFGHSLWVVLAHPFTRLPVFGRRPGKLTWPMSAWRLVPPQGTGNGATTDGRCGGGTPGGFSLHLSALPNGNDGQCGGYGSDLPAGTGICANPARRPPHGHRCGCGLSPLPVSQSPLYPVSRVWDTPSAPGAPRPGCRDWPCWKTFFSFWLPRIPVPAGSTVETPTTTCRCTWSSLSGLLSVLLPSDPGWPASGGL